MELSTVTGQSEKKTC